MEKPAKLFLYSELQDLDHIHLRTSTSHKTRHYYLQIFFQKQCQVLEVNKFLLCLQIYDQGQPEANQDQIIVQTAAYPLPAQPDNWHELSHPGRLDNDFPAVKATGFLLNSSGF